MPVESPEEHQDARGEPTDDDDPIVVLIAEVLARWETRERQDTSAQECTGEAREIVAALGIEAAGWASRKTRQSENRFGWHLSERRDVGGGCAAVYVVTQIQSKDAAQIHHGGHDAG